jgi:hypothetical protein
VASVLLENEVARLLDDGAFYILEDKTQMHKPIVLQANTETWKCMYVDFALDENGRYVAVRYYWPKSDFELAVAQNAFVSLTNVRRRELARLKELLGVQF